MTNKKGIKQTYSFIDGELFSFRITDSRDGVIIALRKKGIDFHLTIYKKNQILISHFVHKNEETGVSKRSSDKELSIRDFLEQASLSLEKKIILSYDEQTKCYSFTDEYMEFILGTENELGNQEINLENAIQTAFSEPDFHDSQKFKLINVSQLTKTYPLGFIDVNTDTKIIFPFSKNQMIVVPDNFISEILSILLEKLSIDTFIEEVTTFYNLQNS